MMNAKKIQDDCLKRMLKGGLAPFERMDCFDEFEATRPSQELVKAFYDVWAKDYDQDMSVVEYKNPTDVSGLLCKMIPKDERLNYTILDVGAGTGVGGVKLAEAGFSKIDATDASPGMLEEAKKLGVYTKILPAEILVEGQKMTTVEPESYDIVVSSGSFYPFHLLGGHLKSFLDCAKTGGLIVISACPHDDIKIGLKPVIKELVDAGIVQVLHEVYVPKWYRNDDGTVWALKKHKPLN